MMATFLLSSAALQAPAAAALATAAAGSATRPNVLIFLIDDMGFSDLGAFGSTNHSTPHIDGLVTSGMKFLSWTSAAPICTPSRAALQTGRYPIRTGCIANTNAHRVIPTPSSPGGLDPDQHISIARALSSAGYNTGMSGKWHLGINSDGQDRHYTPNAHGYHTYVGSPWTNAPMCAADADGFSTRHANGPAFCFLTANDTVVQMPLAIENFTGTITRHATDFIDRQQRGCAPFFFLMSFFHVHTPLFTNRTNRGRSAGGEFGDNVEECDDAVGEILGALDRGNHTDDTLVFLLSDNGPYQEEGWAHAGRANWHDPTTGALLGRLRGGKGQVYEGGVRMPAAVRWPGVTTPGSVTHTLVSTMDIFPTVLAAARATAALPAGYVVDGRDLSPVLRDAAAPTAHRVLLLYCGFTPIAARVFGRWKLFWATQRWHTFDPPDYAICTQCCNGVVPAGKLFGVNATQMCQCDDSALEWHAAQPIVYDMERDPLETTPLGPSTWPASAAPTTYAEVWRAANETRDAMVAKVHPEPRPGGGGTCTAGLPAAARQPCCPGCHKPLLGPLCVRDADGTSACTCNDSDPGSL